MPLRRAVACDTDGCLALYLAMPQAGADLALNGARMAGWNVSAGGLTMRCPSCHRGGPTVNERGDCPMCTGPTHDSRHGEVCHFCGHLTPHPADEDGDELGHVDEDQEDEEPRHRLTGATVYVEGSARP